MNRQEWISETLVDGVVAANSVYLDDVLEVPTDDEVGPGDTCRGNVLGVAGAFWGYDLGSEVGIAEHLDTFVVGE